MNQPQKYAKGTKTAGVLVLALFCGQIGLQACGLAWSTPKNHFNGVDERGFVEWFEKVGELPLDKDLNIPLNISFRSDRETVSPYLGKGWQLPLLESHIVQLDERTFRMVTPDGWFWYFSRGKPTDTTIKGASNWAGEIRGNAITIWTDCGWKLDFLNAKIATMTNKEYRIDFIRSGPDGVVTEMRCGSVAVLRVERDPMTGETRALVFGEKRIAIEWGTMPRVLAVDGKSLVKGEDRSLKKLVASEGKAWQFDFGVTSELQPTLKITTVTADKPGKIEANANGASASSNLPLRSFSWEPKTKTILTDNDWTYTIAPGAKPMEYAAIARANSQGQREFWHRDGTVGRETVETIEGIKTVKTWFTSGKLAGKPRRIEQTKGAETKTIARYAYDEQGRILYELDSAGTRTTYMYEGNSRITVRQGNRTVSISDFSPDGNIASMTSFDLKIKAYY